MNTITKLGLGALVLLTGASLLAMRPHEDEKQSPQITAAHLKLASIEPAARRDVDYRLLDARLQQLIKKPAMVGLAVGVVENGRITFLKGYGETLEGSGDPVTPDTVFRWASCSKGLAATMVAKLAEQGKINLNAPVANYAPDLKLPNGNERVATVGDLLSTASASTAMPMPTSLRKVGIRASFDPSSERSTPCAHRALAGTIRTSPSMPRARWSRGSPTCPMSRRSNATSSTRSG